MSTTCFNRHFHDFDVRSEQIQHVIHFSNSSPEDFRTNDGLILKTLMGKGVDCGGLTIVEKC